MQPRRISIARLWSRLLLTSALLAVASASLAGSRKILQVADRLKTTDGFAPLILEKPSVPSVEAIEEAIKEAVKDGSLKEALTGYASAVQSVLDQFCAAESDKSEAGLELAKIATGMLSDAGIARLIEDSRAFEGFFSAFGSPNADLGLLDNLSWLFSSSLFPIENFCVETPSIESAAVDFAGKAQDVIDNVFKEKNLKLAGRILKDNYLRFQSLYTGFCASELTAADFAAEVNNLLEEFLDLHPDVEAMFLGAVKHLLPGKPELTREGIKLAVEGFLAVVPLAAICEPAVPVVTEPVDPCLAVSEACPFSPEEITLPGDLVHKVSEICLTPACLSAVNSSGCFADNILGFTVEACTCYSALAPECRDPAFIETPKAALGLAELGGLFRQGGLDVDPDGEFLEALELSSEAYCPSSNGTVPACRAQGLQIPECARFLPGGNDAPRWDELCCSAPILLNDTCRDFVEFLAGGEALAELVNTRVEEAMSRIFDSSQSPSVRADVLKAEYGVTTFGAALEVALTSACSVLGKLDKQDAKLCAPKLSCLVSQQALGLAAAPFDIAGQVNAILDMTDNLCSEGCFHVALDECFDAELEPYLEFLDKVVANPNFLLEELTGMLAGGKLNFGFLGEVLPLLKPICSDKCQESISTCDDPLLRDLGLLDFSNSFSGMCNFFKILGNSPEGQVSQP